MLKNSASDDVLCISCSPQKGPFPALAFYLKKKHSNAVLRNYVKRAARGNVSKIQERKRIDIRIFSMKKFTWKERPQVRNEIEKFAASIR